VDMTSPSPKRLLPAAPEAKFHPGYKHSCQYRTAG